MNNLIHSFSRPFMQGLRVGFHSLRAGAGGRLLLGFLFALFGTMTASAQEAYAELSTDSKTLTFYYDNLRNSRSGTTYSLNTGGNSPGWQSKASSVTSVVITSAFTNARPTSTYHWFYGMSSLTSLDLTNLNTSNVTNMYAMFEGCSNLKTIYVSSLWNVDNVTVGNSVFYNCTKLVGGQGTKCDGSNYTGIGRAHIDGGSANPGYLTDPNANVAYAVLDNGTLTFYYDKLLASRTGTPYSLNTGSPGWQSNASSVTSVVFTSSFASARPTSTAFWFDGMTNLTSITGVGYLNTSQVTNMGAMYRGCRSLTHVVLTSFNTSQVTSMASMFYGCTGLTSIDLSSFNTSNVTSMTYMFYGCTGLTSLDLTSFNTANVTNMYQMFYACSNLKTIYASSQWNVDNVTNGNSVFFGCTKLVGGQGTKFSNNYTSSTRARIDGGSTNPGYLTDPNANVAYAVLSSDGKTLTFYYDKLLASRTGTPYGLNKESYNPGWLTIASSVTSVVFTSSFGDARPTSTCSWFDGMTNLTSITGISYLNTSQVTNMVSMYHGCRSLTHVELTSFNTSQVTSMSNMFYGCTGLTSIDLSSFNTSNVTSMSSMFQDCTGLTSLDLTNFNTANVTNMNQMFRGCSNLKTIYASSQWNVDNVTNYDNMFYVCTNLVGGQGTKYDSSYTGKSRARIDGGAATPGYLTDPNVTAAYAVLDNGTLTFYYDKLLATRTGTPYGLNVGSNNPGWQSSASSVTSVVFTSSFANARPTTTYYWFAGMSNLTSITGISNLNTSQVTNMGVMFSNCSKLTSIDLSNFNTSQVTYMGSMFYGCTGLTSIDLSAFNTSNVTLMASMFYGCTGLTSLDLTNFNTANVTNMYQMFRGCSNLKTIYASSLWNVDNVTNDNYMFTGCTKLMGGQGTKYDSSYNGKSRARIDEAGDNPGYLSEPNAEMRYAILENNTLTFYCDNLASTRTGTFYSMPARNAQPSWTKNTITTVVFDPSFANARPKSTYRWFFNMTGLTTIEGIENLNTSEVTTMAAMFSGCSSLRNVDLTHFDTGKVTAMNAMFYGCDNLRQLDFSSFDTQNVTSMSSMFAKSITLKTLDLSTFDTGNVTTMESMFSGCSNLTNINLSSFNTQKVTTMKYMFNSCPKLTNLDLSNFNTPSVTDMNSMFYACSALKSLDLSNFDTHNVTDMTYMFGACRGLTSLDVSGFNTQNVTTMNSMFAGCNYLTSLDVSSFNTKKVTDVNYMFWGCNYLTSLDLSSFDLESLTSLSYMFEGCWSLTYLNLISFNTEWIREMTEMFSGCSKLKYIIVGDEWSTESVTSSNKMFYNCSSLVGSMGTAYSAYYTDCARAHIDGGSDYPGYLSGFAQMEAYAALSADGTTLTFYCDTERDQRTGLTTYALNSGANAPAWESAKSAITSVVFDKTFASARPTSTHRWFSGMTQLAAISGILNLPTEDVTNMSRMFDGCSNLTALDLTKFNTAKVTTMSQMFRGCTQLQRLDLTGFDTEAVTDMSNMFDGCSALTSLFASTTWNVANVSLSTNMFTGCTNLVGGTGTKYNSNQTSKTYARLDGGTSAPGYLTDAFAPYAVLSADGKTLTFHHDGARRTRTGTLFGLNTGSGSPGWVTDGTNATIVTVAFTGSFAAALPTSTAHWFDGMSNLNNIINMNLLKTSEVTHMNSMFKGCTKLTSIYLTKFNTAKVVDMSYMFQNCSALTSVSVGDEWTTQNVTSSASMFTGCTNIIGGNGTTYDSAHLDKLYARLDNAPDEKGYFMNLQGYKNGPYAALSADGKTLTFYQDSKRATRTEKTYGLNTEGNSPGWLTDASTIVTVAFDASFSIARPETTARWFEGMTQLTDLSNLENLNTSSATNMSAMFKGCTALVTLDLTSFSTSKVTDMSQMFYGCSNLFCVTVGSGWKTTAVNASTGMFTGCQQIVGGKGTAYSSSHTDAGYARLDGGTSAPGYFVDPSDLVEGTYAVLSTDKHSLTFYSDKLGYARKGTKYELNTGTNTPGWTAYASNVETVTFDGSFAKARPTSTYQWFTDMTELTTITGIENLNTGETTVMSSMFEECYSLQTLDLSHFDTRAVTNMSSMFSNCGSLKSLNLNSFITSAVTDMSNMFSGCESLKELDVTGFDTGNVRYMNSMFSACSGLASIDLSNFNLENVTNMNYMFSNCSKLTGFPLIDRISKIWKGMYQYCTTPTTLTIPTTIGSIEADAFKGCPNIKNVSVGWATPVAADASAFPNRTSQFLYVPKGTKAAYLAANVWKEFMLIREDGVPIVSIQFDDPNVEAICVANWDKNGDGKLQEDEAAIVTTLGTAFQNNTEITTFNELRYFTGLTNISLNAFYNCTALTSVIIPTNVTSINNNAFRGCSSLKKIVIPDGVTSIGNYAFYGCSSLKFVEFPSSITSIGTYAFYSCANIKSFVVNWTTSSSIPTVTTNTFPNRTSQTLFVPTGTTALYQAATVWKDFNPIKEPGDYEGYAVYIAADSLLTFYYDGMQEVHAAEGTVCPLNTGASNPKWYSSNYYYKINKVVFDPSFAAARPTSCYNWFNGMYPLKEIVGIENLNTSQVTNMRGMFSGCKRLTELDLSNFNTSKVTNMYGMFDHCEILETLDVSPFDTRNVTDMTSMFNNCKAVKSLDVSGFDTRNVTTMTNMFSTCQTITSLDLTHFNTEKVTNMNSMFYGCRNIKAFDLRSFNTSKVTNMRQMFHGCYALDSLDLSNFNTENVTNMMGMFMCCLNLKKIDVSSFNTSNVTTMMAMFGSHYLYGSDGCASLETLDLSNFDTRNVTDMSSMFYKDTNLTTVKVGPLWSTEKLSPETGISSVFTNCYNIIGGRGTTYDPDHIQADYAHIDGGPANPGYLTGPNTFLRGDVNDDGKVTIADVTALVNIILGKTTSYNAEVADINSDTKITIADVTALVNIILGK